MEAQGNKIRAIIQNGELFLSNKDLIEFISEEINADSKRQGKTYSKFAKKIFRILVNYQKKVDKKEEL